MFLLPSVKSASVLMTTKPRYDGVGQHHVDYQLLYATMILISLVSKRGLYE